MSREFPAIKVWIRELPDGDVLKATANLHYIEGNRLPYFSVTGEVYGPRYIRGEETISHGGRRLWLHSGGCIHETIAANIPELAEFVRWHLCDLAGVPMHYEANAICHAGYGRYGEDKPEAFVSTTLWGLLPEDHARDRRSHGEAILRERLRARLPKLQKAFHAAMVELFGPDTMASVRSGWGV